METFQKTVLFCALIVLIFALVIIGVALSNASSTNWPPMIPACPDYWLIDGSGNDTTCTNIKDLGTCPPKDGKHLIMNFNDALFTGDNGARAKYDWAKKCNISWDGVTYGVDPPS